MSVSLRIVCLCLALSPFTDALLPHSSKGLEPPGAQGPTTPRKRMEFEVVSIRPTGKDVGPSYVRTADGITATRQTLTSLILLAYVPVPLWSGDRVKNAPEWGLKDTFDIKAKVAPEDLATWRGRGGEEMQMTMMRALLAQRFQLQIHTEPLDMKGFALVKSRQSSSLRPSSPSEALPDFMKLKDGGVAQSRKTPDGIIWSFYGTSMKSLTGYLTLGSHTIVEDKTGLAGNFDFDLHHIDNPQSFNQGGISDPSDRWDLGPLGLKTVATSVHSLRVVVDHAEHPSPN